LTLMKAYMVKAGLRMIMMDPIRGPSKFLSPPILTNRIKGDKDELTQYKWPRIDSVVVVF